MIQSSNSGEKLWQLAQGLQLCTINAATHQIECIGKAREAEVYAHFSIKELNKVTHGGGEVGEAVQYRAS